MTNHTLITIAVSLVSLVSVPAMAQESDEPTSHVATTADDDENTRRRAPRLATLAAVGDGTHVAVQNGVLLPDKEEYVLNRFALFGELDLNRRWGVAAELPFTAAVADHKSAAVVGSPAGWLTYRSAGDGPSSWRWRFGLALPGDEDDELDGPTIDSQMTRLQDIVQAFPRSSAVRSGVSWVYDGTSLFLRLDGGLDTIVVPEEEIAIPFLNAGAAVGVNVGPHTLALELITIGSLFHDEGLHTAAATMSLYRSLFVSVGTVLGDERHEGDVVVNVGGRLDL